jgi:hypothetical protein
MHELTLSVALVCPYQFPTIRALNILSARIKLLRLLSGSVSLWHYYDQKQPHCFGLQH